MAEAVINRHGASKFRAFSAGVQPSSRIAPVVLDVLREAGYDTADLRPKHWQELSGSGGPSLDFVFTLSDTAAGETLPEWRGKPATAHWGYPDPIRTEGAEWEKVHLCPDLAGLERQLRIFMQLPFASLDQMALKASSDELASSNRERS